MLPAPFSMNCRRQAPLRARCVSRRPEIHAHPAGTLLHRGWLKAVHPPGRRRGSAPIERGPLLLPASSRNKTSVCRGLLRPTLRHMKARFPSAQKPCWSQSSPRQEQEIPCCFLPCMKTKTNSPRHRRSIPRADGSRKASGASGIKLRQKRKSGKAYGNGGSRLVRKKSAARLRRRRNR